MQPFTFDLPCAIARGEITDELNANHPLILTATCTRGTRSQIDRQVHAPDFEEVEVETSNRGSGARSSESLV